MHKEDIIFINHLKEVLRKLSHYHPSDDDPYSDFYTVREKRRSIREKIKKVKDYNSIGGCYTKSCWKSYLENCHPGDKLTYVEYCWEILRINVAC